MRFVTAVAFAADGRSLAAGGADEAVTVWRSAETLIQSVCEQVWRNLTMEEWTCFVGSDVPYESTCPELPPGEGAPDATVGVVGTPEPASNSQTPSVPSDETPAPSPVALVTPAALSASSVPRRVIADAIRPVRRRFARNVIVNRNRSPCRFRTGSRRWTDRLSSGSSVAHHRIACR